jgi:hypothetical protein
MRFPVPRLLLLALALVGVLLVPASAVAKSSKRTYPVIKKVTPLKIAIGAKLTIKGTGFKAGKGVNSVVFKRDGKPAVFVKSGLSTKKKIYVTVPDKLQAFLGADGDGSAVPTRFRLRVLASRFSKRFTSTKLSPVVKPKPGSESTPAGTYQECQDKAKANANGDIDGDGLTNGTELTYGVDPCNVDSDGDSVQDGYEFWSARDLNGKAIPYPGKKPYPNALDGSDANLDFDGDGLTLTMEYQAWTYTGKPQPLSYSDGEPYTGGTALRDGDKDVDNDGLTNFQETTGPMKIDWWTAVYDGVNEPKETVYPDAARRFAEPSFVDPDTDGDGVLDGYDDQDHDGYPNWFEVTRPLDWKSTYTSTKFPWHTGTHENPLARVQPFNPCKPITSPACHNPAPIGYYQPDEDWYNPVTWNDAPPMGPSPGSRL